MHQYKDFLLNKSYDVLKIKTRILKMLIKWKTAEVENQVIMEDIGQYIECDLLDEDSI